MPFPQANDIDKIIDLILNFNNGLNNKWAISEFFGFDERQGDYYGNAAVYLGLLQKNNDNSEFEINSRNGEYTLKTLNRKL